MRRPWYIETIAASKPLRCLACGEPIERPLASLGSLRCADCRSDRRPLDPVRVEAFARPSAPRRARG